MTGLLWEESIYDTYKSLYKGRVIGRDFLCRDIIMLFWAVSYLQFMAFCASQALENVGVTLW